MGAYSVRRAPGIHIKLERRQAVDLDRLQQGEAALREQEQLIAYVAASGREYILDQSDVALLSSVSSVRWESAEELASRQGVDLRVVDLMVEYGLLWSDQESPAVPGPVSLWHEDALFFHQRTKWEGVDAQLPDHVEDARKRQAASERFFSERRDEQGGIPPHFHERTPPEQRIELPLSDYQSSFIETLGKRQTTRRFDTEVALDFGLMNTALQNVFGCQGTSPLSANVTGIRKTSPSGGAMHPVEAYPMVIRVDGLEPGIYHYHTGEHALEPLSTFSEQQGRRLARLFTAGQGYYSTAQVLILYTARYARSFWKYRRNPRAYRVAQLDLGHLSQTLYLMCADLGLGAFFTAACNEGDIEKHLDIDGVGEGAMAVGGFGIPAQDSDTMNLQVVPYTPPRGED